MLSGDIHCNNRYVIFASAMMTLLHSRIIKVPACLFHYEMARPIL